MLSPPETAIAAPGDPADRDGRAEVVRKPLALFFRCRIQQPHQHEEGHHRSDEIGIGDLPCAAVMPVTARDLLPLDDDRRDTAVDRHVPPPLSFTPKSGLAVQRLRLP
jgi:hypothetical protein